MSFSATWLLFSFCLPLMTSNANSIGQVALNGLLNEAELGNFLCGLVELFVCGVDQRRNNLLNGILGFF